MPLGVSPRHDAGVPVPLRVPVAAEFLTGAGVLLLPTGRVGPVPPVGADDDVRLRVHIDVGVPLLLAQRHTGLSPQPGS